MRSGTNCTIASGNVYSWALECLLQAKLVKDHGWKCTAAAVLGIVLRAAARSISVSAACRDLAKGPSDQAVMTALEDGLPKTLSVLERRLNEALTDLAPRRLPRRRKWQVASGDRLAFVAVLRAALPEPQRTLLRQATSRNHEVSCPRHGLHRGVRATLGSTQEIRYPKTCRRRQPFRERTTTEGTEVHRGKLG